MEPCFQTWSAAYVTIAILAIAIVLASIPGIRFQTDWKFHSDYRDTANKRNNTGSPTTHRHGEMPSKDNRDIDVVELRELKELYYQLHNLELFPEALPRARELLFALLKETSAAAHRLPEHESILSVQSFTRQGVEDFQRKRDKQIGEEWQQYHSRRKDGGSRELFGDREEAIWWLKQIAPVKYVDGAWLGHIGKVTTPFALLKTMKMAWQILSEELGDGNCERNHVYVYHKLLQTLEPGFPAAELRDFGHTRHGLDETAVWKAALAQLIVSLFPCEFLAEVLGYNLHFEAISMDTLKAANELKEVEIDPYYFILHVSIDNAHSGHSAIAIEVICEYMNSIRRSQGDEAAHKAWEKIQAGYNLSCGLPGTTICPSRRAARGDDSKLGMSSKELDVIRIFKAKAQVVHGIHCSSKVRIGARKVAEWLDPVALESNRWQRELLDALSSSQYWIQKGDSSRSRFIQELQWTGRMFGSFTQEEYDVLSKWIDGLPNTSLPTENVVRGPILDEVDGMDDIHDDRGEYDNAILSGYPALKPSIRVSCSEATVCPLLRPTSYSFQTLPPLNISERVIVKRFLPVWLSHPCLLEAFVSVPSRTRDRFACTIVKILRAQKGFEIEQDCVAGMGEVWRRSNSLGLAGIGINMIAQQGLSLVARPSLKHVLQAWPSKFSIQMLHLSRRPLEHRGLLIGIATGFAKMHIAVVMCGLSLMSAQDRDILQKIACREMEGLELCWTELQRDEKMHGQCCGGYMLARGEIEKCFRY